MKRVIAIFEPSEKLTIKELNDLYHEQIDNASGSPHVHFITSHKFTFIIRYLEKKRFRNVTIYHTSEKTSKHSFKKREGFSSFIELHEALMQDSNEQIYGKEIN
jgi:hypothetical protein